MQKRMTELLGDTDAEPMQINTNTAKHVNDANVRMAVQNAAQASEQIPMPVAAPQMTAQPQPTPAPAPQPQPQPQQYQETVPVSYVQNIYAQGYQQQSFVNPAQTVMTQMQAAQVQAPQMHYLQQQQQATQSMDPRAAAIQLQQLQAEEAHRVQYEQATAAQQQALTQQQARQAQTQAQHKNLRVNDSVVKKAAEATILQSQKAPQQQPAEEPVQVIQPAYITQLETDLAGDMQQKSKMSAMQRAMMTELADDEITIEASKIEAKPDPAQTSAKKEVDNTPKEVLAAMQSVTSSNIAPNPNIAPSTPTEINANIEHDK